MRIESRELRVDGESRMEIGELRIVVGYYRRELRRFGVGDS